MQSEKKAGRTKLSSINNFGKWRLLGASPFCVVGGWEGRKKPNMKTQGGDNRGSF